MPTKGWWGEEKYMTIVYKNKNCNTWPLTHTSHSLALSLYLKSMFFPGVFHGSSQNHNMQRGGNVVRYHSFPELLYCARFIILIVQRILVSFKDDPKKWDFRTNTFLWQWHENQKMSHVFSAQDRLLGIQLGCMWIELVHGRKLDVSFLIWKNRWAWGGSTVTRY